MAYSEDGTLTLKILAQDLASGKLGQFTTHLDAMAKKGGLVGSVFQGIGISFGMMLNPAMLVARGIGMVTDILGDAVTAAMEEEAGIAQLTRSLQENSVGWDGNIARIEEVISAREKLAFADGEQRDSLRQLVAITKDHDEALRIQGIAMDFARLKGIDLASATEILGKVAAGSFVGLRKMGIVLDETATSADYFAEVQKRAAGQAEAFAETTQGKMVRASIALENAMESLGMSLTPVVGQLAEVAADLIPQIVSGVGDLIDEVRRFDPAFDRVMRVNDAIDELAETMSLSGPVVDDMRTKWAGMARESDRVTGTQEELVAAIGAAEEGTINLARWTKLYSDHALSAGRSANVEAGEIEGLDEALQGLADGGLKEVRTEARQTAREIRRLLGEDDPPTLENIQKQIRELELLRDKAALAGDEMAFAKAVVGIKRLKEQEGAITDARGAARSHAAALRATALADIKAALAAGNETRARRIAARVTDTHKEKTNLLKDALNSLPPSKRIPVSLPGVDSAIADAEALSRALSIIPNQVPGVGAGRPAKLGPHLPQWHRLVPTTGFAFLERGEAVISKEDNARGRGGRGVTVNINGASFLGDAHSAQQWARAAAPAIVREMRRLGA